MSEQPKKSPIEPTIGRMVLFQYGDKKTYPAVINGVHGDVVDLSVLTKSHVEQFDSVRYGKDSLEWRWMEYQLGQAKKTQEAEAKLAEGTSPTLERKV